MSTKRFAPASCAAAIRFARALHHDALELLRAALTDRDQVHDGVGARCRGAQAVRVGHVALGELGAPGLERLAAAAVAHERAHVVPRRAESVHDLRPDEAGGAGDEDHCSKFFQ